MSSTQGRLATVWLLWVAVIFPIRGSGQEVVDLDTVPRTSSIKHTSKGFTFTTADGNYELQLAGRLQFRFASPFDQDPLTNDDFNEQDQATFKINRARLKIGGHAYMPWLKYYFEYEMGQSNLLDFKVMVERYKGLSLKVGQWKTDFNRERVISSGEQQMVERSLINRPFTLDRQQGMQIYGRFDGGGLADINYWVSALTGTGRGARENNDLELMYVARLQWNFLGEDVEMSGCDLERTRRPSAIIALAGAMNRSPYTRFAQSGGGDLEGFAGGDTSLYDVRQVVVESAFKYKGFSWQHESHWKHVEDVHIGGSRDLVGSYMQVGYFPHGGLNWMPSELEVAGRFAIYRPDVDIPDNLEHEYSVAVNWFFKAGHKNKLTAEYGYIAFQQKGVPYNQGSRLRVQWDISF